MSREDDIKPLTDDISPYGSEEEQKEEIEKEIHDRQAQAITHFEDMERLFNDDCLHACTRRWNTLSHSLKVREYHSLTRTREAMLRVPL